MAQSGSREILRCQAGHAWEQKDSAGSPVCPQCGAPALDDSPSAELEDEQDYEGYGPH